MLKSFGMTPYTYTCYILCEAFLCIVCSQLENEKEIKNETVWALKEYYANYTLHHNVTENIPPPNISPADVIRGPCWETEVGIVGTVSTNIAKLVSNSHCLNLHNVAYYFQWKVGKAYSKSHYMKYCTSCQLFSLLINAHKLYFNMTKCPIKLFWFIYFLSDNRTSII